MTPCPTPTTPEPLALVLGSGGARGWAHFGVLDVMEDLGIVPDIVTGCSIGALIGAAVASRTLEGLRRKTESLDWWESAKLMMQKGVPKGGLLDGRNITNLLAEIYDTETIESLPISFAAVATDLNSGKPFVWNKGSLLDAVRSSISIPGAFSPLAKDDTLLVDGGLTNPLPIDLAIEMGAKRIIAVDINLVKGHPLSRKPKEPDEKKSTWHRNIKKLDKKLIKPFREWFDEKTRPNIFDVMSQTVRICENEITKRCLIEQYPDVLIQPAVGHIHALEFHHFSEAWEAGHSAAMKQSERLKAIARKGTQKPCTTRTHPS